MSSEVTHAQRGKARARGFTLVEMMIVVVIVGVLSALAVYGVRKYILSSKTSEALEMLRAIKAAQESYRAETFTYLNVTGTFDSTLTGFYPTTDPSDKKTMWGVDNVGFETLGVRTDAPTMYAYGCVAGGPDTVPLNPKPVLDTLDIGNWPTAAGRPWYVAVAVGDLDGDGERHAFASTSFTGQVFESQDGSY